MRGTSIHKFKEDFGGKVQYYCRPGKPFKTITQYSYDWKDVTCPHCLRYKYKAIRLENIKMRMCDEE